MIKSTTRIRVRYSETDQMGFVYYGNYPQYLEIGRVDALKSIGVIYKDIEEKGYLLPVRELNIKYHKAALYDDELIIETVIKEQPSNKVIFHYRIFREEELLITAETTLFFMNEKKKACKPPAFFVNQIAPFFS